MMHIPVMQQEWQRRQSQRSVWALLGLLAIVSATAATPVRAVLPPVGVAQTSISVVVPVGETVSPSTPRTLRTGSSARYWRHLAPIADEQIRLRLGLHAEPRPTVSSLAVYLRRFLRPPTP